MPGPQRQFTHVVKVRLADPEWQYVADLAHLMQTSASNVLGAMVAAALQESQHRKEVLAR